jgi:hypothetical protein
MIGLQWHKDAPAAAPVYFKIGPGLSSWEMYYLFTILLACIIAAQ